MTTRTRVEKSERQSTRQDRRYFLAFGFCHKSLTFYYFDRSGAIYSKMYDIDEKPQMFLRVAIGILFTALVMLAAAKLATLPLWAAAAIAGFLGGALQPYLFKNLRYR